MQERVEIDWQLAAAADAAPEEFLSGAELQKLAQMRFPRRREEWLLGRWTAKRLLRAAVPSLGERSLVEFSVANEEDGLPYVLAGGLRLPGCLSISHRGGRAACAWTPATSVGLGIDLEKVEPRTDAFIQDYFTPAERDLVSGEQHDRDAVLIWSVKESMLKALGKGLRLDTRAVEVLRIADYKNETGWGHLAVRCHARPELAWWAGWRAADGFVITLAVCGEHLDSEALHIRELRA